MHLDSLSSSPFYRRWGSKILSPAWVAIIKIQVLILLRQWPNCFFTEPRINNSDWWVPSDISAVTSRRCCDRFDRQHFARHFAVVFNERFLHVGFTLTTPFYMLCKSIAAEDSLRTWSSSKVGVQVFHISHKCASTPTPAVTVSTAYAILCLAYFICRQFYLQTIYDFQIHHINFYQKVVY